MNDSKTNSAPVIEILQPSDQQTHSKNDPTIEKSMLVGASYLFLFKTISQVASWAITFIIARLLEPADYGLLSMSTIITGFAAMFSELGLGAAIIQRQKVSDSELSSLFWFGLGFSFLLAIAALLVAYPTSYIFNEPRTIPLTQATSILFILTGLQIVPLNLLKKKLNFKMVGLIESVGVVISSIVTLGLAKAGFGAWALLIGQILKAFSDLTLYFLYAKWKPGLHFSYKEARSYFGFGFKVMLANSLYYLHSRSDRFFAGQVWNAQQLGLYGFAKELAHIPTERFVTIVNQITFAGFSKLQDDKARFQAMYLNVVKIIATIVFPVFIGGFVLGDELIKLVLNSKWYAMSTVFRYFCLIELAISVNSINGFVHTSQGRPGWNLAYNSVLAIALPISFWLLLQPNLESILIPWFTTYFSLNIIWAYISLKKAGIPLRAHLSKFINPVCGTIMMVAFIFLFKGLVKETFFLTNPVITLSFECFIGFFTYVSYMFIFDKNNFIAAIDFIKKGKK